MRADIYILCAAFAGTVLSAIGPAADLHVSNAVINPDGAASRSATVVNGAIDRTIITANIVSVLNYC
jgi:hypothetical protein